MIPPQVARRYAKALFMLGEESGQLEALVGELSRAAETYESSSELRGALDNPMIPYAAKKGILGDVATRLTLSTTAKHTLFLLCDRRRMRALPGIVRELRTLSDKKRGVVRAEVISAKPLSPAYLARLGTQLERITGNKVALDTREDAELLAGIVVRIGDRIYDGSLAARVRTLRTQLLPN